MKRLGPWTPPIWQVRLAHIQWVMVYALGRQPGAVAVMSPLPQNVRWRLPWSMMASQYGSKNGYCWNIQPHRGGGRDASASLPPPIPILTGQLSNSSSSPLQIHVALQRRKQLHSKILAVQVNATIPHLQLEIHVATVSHLAHSVAGWILFIVNSDSNPAFTPPCPQQLLHIRCAALRFCQWWQRIIFLLFLFAAAVATACPSRHCSQPRKNLSHMPNSEPSRHCHCHCQRLNCWLEKKPTEALPPSLLSLDHFQTVRLCCHPLRSLSPLSNWKLSRDCRHPRQYLSQLSSKCHRA